MSNQNYKAVPAEIHRKRGSCCKSSCIHCPYGYTLKKLGLKFKDVTEKNKEESCEIEGFSFDLDLYSLDDYKFIVLKDFICGIIRKDKLFVRELFLLNEFQDQGLDKPLVESYYFY